MAYWLEPIAGTLLMALALADVFLTVLYARAGTGIISDRLARLIWLALRRVSSAGNGNHLLSFCGLRIPIDVAQDSEMISPSIPICSRPPVPR